MKKLLLSLIVIAVPVSAWCQAPPKAKPVSPLLPYAGEWTSVFGGRVWLRLQLELHGDQITGSLVHPKSVDLNDSGELKAISEEQSTETVTEAALNPDGLLISLRDADTQESERYMMRVILPEGDKADLKMIGMAVPPGMSKPKPWRLVKSGIAATKDATPR